MSASSAPSSGDSVLIFLVILVLLVLRRVYRTYHGTRFRVSSTILVLIFYVAIGSLFSVTSFFEGVSIFFAAPYLIVLFIAAIWSYRFADKRIGFWRGGDGQVYFRGGMLLYIIYVVALIARLSIELIVIGPSFLNFTPTVTLSGSALYATIATDLLMMLGIGLLIGRNIRVFMRYRRIEEGKEPLPDTPPDYESLFGRKKDPV